MEDPEVREEYVKVEAEYKALEELTKQAQELKMGYEIDEEDRD